jgi:hypothetical protein
MALRAYHLPNSLKNYSITALEAVRETGKVYFYERPALCPLEKLLKKVD